MKIQLIGKRSSLARYKPGPVQSWWWRVVAKNGKILCHSEQYVSKQAARKGLSALAQALTFDSLKIEELTE